MKETDKIWHTSLQFLLKNISPYGLVQDWSISIANVSCFKQLIYTQYIAVRYNTILYNTKYERRKAITMFRQLTKDTPYLTRNEFFGEKKTCDIESALWRWNGYWNLNKNWIKENKTKIFMCCCAPDEASAMHKLGTISRLAIIATDALAPHVTKPSTAMNVHSK